MADLPFKAEYAKSGRASCKGCKTPIPQGQLRIAAMLQSAFFDGKQANWFHDTCFFGKHRPKSIADIGNFSTLRYEDQEKIKTQIESNGCGAVLAEEVKTGKGKGKKRANGGDTASSAALKDFSVEYSKSSRATCKVCDIKITKGEVRICKKIYDSEIGQKFGGQAVWHHVTCFAQEKSSLLFFACGDVLPGFNSLKKEDQVMVKKELPGVKTDDIPIKKLKEEPKSKEEIEAKEKEEKELKEQNKIFYKYRDSLKNNCKKNDLKIILESNNQEIPTGEDKMLDLLADIMTFGVLLKCESCNIGQLSLDTNGYTCSGNVSAWTKCQAVTQNPKRGRFKVPSSLKDNSAFTSYKYKARTRRFRTIEPSTSQTIQIEDEMKKPKVEQRIPPLKNLEFHLLGLGSKTKEDLKIKILKMGGKIAPHIVETLAAVVSTEEETLKESSKMIKIKNLDVPVIEKSFFNGIKPEGSVAETLALITEKKIVDWGSDYASRIPQDVVDGKSVPKSSKSIYSKSSSGVTKLKLKGGTAVDPDSGLDEIAHVYIDSQKNKFSVVLGLTDIVSQKNSFYKLQVLESDTRKQYWVFRSWGRIGTTIGGNKTENFHTLYEAVANFEELYLDKTGHHFDFPNMESQAKIPGKMHPIDIDYSSTETPKEIEMEDSKSILPVPVKTLIKMIFDIAGMKRVMLEFELDTEKMPLGKLSKKQLKSGYKVLTELQNIFSNSKDDKSIQTQIIDATNRFYTLIPHDFGVGNPPLLDDEEKVKIKSSMLDNLLELEIAYTLLQNDSDDKSVCALDSHYIKLKCDIEPILPENETFKLIKNYVKNTHAETHSMYDLDIVELFEVRRDGEDKRYKPFKKLPNRKLLWHGSRTTNFAGILSQGLRIAPPEAPVTGYMFGKGIYFADMVSKSANYCCTNTNNPIGCLLLCEVALGKMHELTAAKNVTKLPSGFHSVKGMGQSEPDPAQDHTLECGTVIPLGTPLEKKIKSSLLYNEYIVYDVAQVNVKYLVQLKFNYKF